MDKKMRKATKNKEKIQVTLRRMKEEDLPEVMALGKSTSGFAVSEKSSFWPEEMLRSWIANSKDPLIIAEREGKIIGFALVAVYRPTGKAILENIVVKKEYLNKGVGSQLLKYCLKKLEGSGIKYIEALSKPEDVSSNEFLIRHGFKRGNDFVWFEKFLEEIWRKNK